ncbi:MAG TPA: GNAT family N-acetyltransferase [Ohtaekwangia sp.]|nr:GNAT family N-acetyltransferase [Ohtaekwangia sp.]
MHFREATKKDIPAILALHQAVAEAGGIARRPHEITHAYVKTFTEQSTTGGLIIVCEDPVNPNHLIAEVHAHKKGVAAFNHVLSNLTVVVHPNHQGKKIGRTIFTIFLEEIALHRNDIGRVELIAHESNARAISLYQSLGFVIEGRMEMRFKLPDGKYEADIPMSWKNPNFETD